MEIMRLNTPQRMAGLRREFETEQRNKKADTDIEDHFKSMSYVGKALWDIYLKESNKRASAFKNKRMTGFMRSFFHACETWSNDHRYRFEDIMILAALTDEGILFIQILAKPGSEKVPDGQSLKPFAETIIRPKSDGPEDVADVANNDIYELAARNPEAARTFVGIIDSFIEFFKDEVKDLVVKGPSGAVKPYDFKFELGG